MTQRPVSWGDLTGLPVKSDRVVCFSVVVRDLLPLRHWGVRGQRLNQDFRLALCVSNSLRVCGSTRRRIKGSVKRLLLNELELTLYEMWGYRVWKLLFSQFLLYRLFYNSISIKLKIRNVVVQNIALLWQEFEYRWNGASTLTYWI